MKNRVIVITIMILLISIISLSLFNNKSNTLENSKIERDKTYAVMLQNEDKTGYVESTSNTFPSDMILNEELTNCVDESGNKVTNPFTYENGVITVRTSKKIYCYLYFDVGISSFGNQLLENPTSGLNTTIEGGLYRYQGASGTVDNYICFGTSDKNTCTGNTDAYLYRIIGITEEGRIKVIKNEALDSRMRWYNNYTSDKVWIDSEVYSNINGSSFLKNETYMPSGWEDKIEATIWKYGDVASNNISSKELYNIEDAWTNTVDAKIGLMYAHDYAYAYQSGGLNCSSSGEYSTCKTAWINITVSDPSAPSSAEWFMSRIGGNSSGRYYAWSSASAGYAVSSYLSDYLCIRPVFYLTSDVQVIGGTGKSDDPFIIQ